jgi:hypothetical protein
MNMRRLRLVVGVLGFALVAFPVPAVAQSASGAELERGFARPPDTAKPRAWWHWMNGNVTKEGITADLEWMKRVGIAGFQMFDGDLGTPQLVENRLVEPHDRRPAEAARGADLVVDLQPLRPAHAFRRGAGARPDRVGSPRARDTPGSGAGVIAPRSPPVRRRAAA